MQQNYKFFMARGIVIIPTFNEIENIEAIVKAVFALATPFHVLIVDDNSPDGTAAKVEELQKELYSVVKTKDLSEEELKSTQKRYFQILYNLLLGTSKGPKLGLFLLALDKDKVKELI